jgi:hypothetical protein
MSAACGNACQVCSRSKKTLFVDHCHDSGLVRGLLCQRCNTAIGLLGDDSAGVRLALKYLENHESKHNGTAIRDCQL